LLYKVVGPVNYHIIQGSGGETDSAKREMEEEDKKKKGDHCSISGMPLVNAVSPHDSQMDLANIKLCSIAACAQIICTQQLYGTIIPCK
jgi:hypothetical protein